jgi:hypothetical protein
MRKSSDLGIMGVSLSAVVSVLFATGALGFETYNEEPITYEQTGFVGNAVLVQKDPDGNIKAYRQTDNIITNVGKSCAAMELFGQATTNTTGSQQTMCGGGGANSGLFNYVGIGTSGTSEAVGDTSITGGLTRAQDTGVGLVNGTNTYAIIQPAAFTGIAATIQEAGLFDAGGTAGNHMFARKTFTSIVLTASDSLTVTWRISLS